jgi:hypothetical protein
MPELKMGESAVFWITLRPFGRTCAGSKIPVGVGEITMRTGIRKAVMVVGLLFAAGSVPTMVKLLPPAERLPVQCVMVGVAGAARFSR